MRWGSCVVFCVAGAKATRGAVDTSKISLTSWREARVHGKRRAVSRGTALARTRRRGLLDGVAGNGRQHATARTRVRCLVSGLLHSIATKQKKRERQSASSGPRTDDSFDPAQTNDDCHDSPLSLSLPHRQRRRVVSVTKQTPCPASSRANAASTSMNVGNSPGRVGKFPACERGSLVDGDIDTYHEGLRVEAVRLVTLASNPASTETHLKM